MSCCGGNVPVAVAAKCDGPCGQDKKTTQTPVPAVAPEKPNTEGSGGCENGSCKCGPNCNCNPCTCNNNNN